MYLENLQLHHFRNYQELDIQLSPQVNVFLGANAQGKTNLLEAIYVLALARSHRTSNDKDLIFFQDTYAKLQGDLQKKLGKVPLEMTLNSKGKRVKVNHLEKKSLSQYVGQMNLVLFAPEDLAIIKGSPAGRRRFLDMELSQVDPQYLYYLNQYRKVLKQRNRYLKLQAHASNDPVYLEVLTEQLAHWGSKVIKKRGEFLSLLQSLAAPIQEEISDQQEQLTLEYMGLSTLDQNWDAWSESDILTKLQTEYQNVAPQESKRCMTLAGPHRDDIGFLVNGKSLQFYGSQGQQRTAVLALKLAEIEVMKEKTGEYPVLLLDDVLSELDSSRQTHLLKTIAGKVQTFLTTPSLSEVELKIIDQPRIFTVEDGKLLLQQAGTRGTVEKFQSTYEKRRESDREIEQILGIADKNEE